MVGRTGFSSWVYIRMFLIGTISRGTICKLSIISSRRRGTECLYDKNYPALAEFELNWIELNWIELNWIESEIKEKQVSFFFGCIKESRRQWTLFQSSLFSILRGRTLENVDRPCENFYSHLIHLVRKTRGLIRLITGIYYISKCLKHE